MKNKNHLPSKQAIELEGKCTYGQLINEGFKCWNVDEAVNCKRSLHGTIKVKTCFQNCVSIQFQFACYEKCKHSTKANNA